MANEDIKYLTDEVAGLLNYIRNLILNKQFDFNNKQQRQKWDEMVDKAFELHKLVNPKHSKTMLRNRGVDPNTREFYNHIHPIEDLLAIIANPNINDIPEDKTLGTEFSIKIFSRRWNHEDVYKFLRTFNGWSISNLSGKVQCDKKGYPALYIMLNHDSINYPESLPNYLEWLWDQAQEIGLDYNQVQEELSRLADWINICEKNSPKGIFEDYK